MAKIVAWNEDDIAFQKSINSRVLGGNGSQKGPAKRRRGPRGSSPASSLVTVWMFAQVPAAQLVTTGAHSAQGVVCGVADAVAYLLEYDSSLGKLVHVLDDTISGADKRVKIAVVNPNPYIVGLGLSDAERAVVTGESVTVEITGTSKEAIQLPTFDLAIFPGFDKTKTQVPYRPKDSRENKVGGKACS